jgi:hypothetical protein
VDGVKDDDLLKTARERFTEAETSDRAARDRAQDDLRHLVGDPWPDKVRQEREAEGKPCITINRYPQFVRQVTGQLRQMNPAIRVVAADQSANEDTAEIYQGLIRQIEYASDAQSVYEATAESAAACSIGNFRVRADYEDGLTFDQKICIERIHNPFGVFWDPLAKAPTRADARYCFIAEEMAREDFKEQYPDANLADVTAENKADGFAQWITAKTVTVAEYYWIEHETVDIALLGNGMVMRDPPAGFPVAKRRKVRLPKVKWAKISARDVLEGPLDVPCDYIPVVAVTGEEWHIGEEMYRSSVIRFAKDPGQLYNFARSSMAEIMALQPKAPYLVTTKQVNGLETFWNEANKANRPYLPYHPDEKAGMPQRVQPPVSSQAVTQEVMMAAEDMKATTGIYDASLGAKSNETSGVAIRERKSEGQLSNSVYADNLVKAIVQTGKILVSMIPKVYDTQRVLRILGEDDQEKAVPVNTQVIEGGAVIPINDLTMGKYDVRISVGPAYETKRQEAAEGMFAFMQALPQAGPLIADLIAKMQDWPESDRVAERLRKLLPPGMAEEDPGPEQMQAQQMQMQAQQQAAEAQQAMAEAELRKAQAEATEAEADAIKAQAEAQVAMAQLNAGMVPVAPMGAPFPQG